MPGVGEAAVAAADGGGAGEQPRGAAVGGGWMGTIVRMGLM